MRRNPQDAVDPAPSQGAGMKKASSVVSKPSPSSGEETQTAFWKAAVCKKWPDVFRKLPADSGRALRNLASAFTTRPRIASQEIVLPAALVADPKPLAVVTATSAFRRDWSAWVCIPAAQAQPSRPRKFTTGFPGPVLGLYDQGHSSSNWIRLGIGLPCTAAVVTDPIVIAAAQINDLPDGR